MPKTKKELTLSRVTSQVAGPVRRLMAGELVTVVTSRSWDLETDRPLFVTAVTFPPRHPNAGVARGAVLRIPGVRKADVNPATGYMTIVREA